MSSSSENDAANRRAVALIREFNRFYTRQIGLLQEGLLASPFSLTEARVMYELSQRTDSTASELAAALGINHGYLSRILRRFQSLGLIQKARSATDGRQLLLTLTGKGRRAYGPLDARANSEIKLLLKDLSTEEVRHLLEAAQTIRRLLSAKATDNRAYVLRPPQPGDYGWVIGAHGELYSREYAWNEEIEKLAAEIVAKYLENFDAKADRCWIAESEGQPVGCVFVMKESRIVAKLRLLLVSPRARGLGIGSRLVSECVRFTRQAGYKRLKLWTQNSLTGARKIYQKHGFQLIDHQPHHSFGRDLVGEHWELRL